MTLQSWSGSYNRLQQHLTEGVCCQNRVSFLALLQTFTETTFHVCNRKKKVFAVVYVRHGRVTREYILSLSYTDTRAHVSAYTHTQTCPKAIKISAEGGRFLRMCEVTVLGNSPASPPAGPCCMRTSWLTVFCTLKLGALKGRGCSFHPAAAERVSPQTR